jgi:hypothetical protein
VPWRGSGSKRRKIEIECASNKVVEIEAESEDECEEELGRVMEDVGDVQVGDLWTGDDMGMYGTDTRDSGSMCGTINFFNIDGIDAAGHAVGEVVRNNKRTNCIISNIVDQQSDWVNVGSRVEQAFKQEYGSANNVCFSHSATKHTQKLPGAGECTTAIMPELRSRAGKCIRDCRGWGRYSGTVIDGRYLQGVQQRLVVIGVYAACMDNSAAGAAQVQDIARMQGSSDCNTAKIVKGKNAHTMLLHDLEVERNKLRRVWVRPDTAERQSRGEGKEDGKRAWSTSTTDHTNWPTEAK